MKPILIVLLTICLESCKMPRIILPTIKDHERCSAFIIEIEDELFEGKCRCHQYRISEKFIGRISESYDLPLTYCSNQVQFSATTWSDEYLYFFDELFFMKENKRAQAREK